MAPRSILAELKSRFKRGEVAFGDAIALRRLAAHRYGCNGGEDVHIWIAHALAGIVGRLTVH